MDSSIKHLNSKIVLTTKNLTSTVILFGTGLCINFFNTLILYISQI